MPPLKITPVPDSFTEFIPIELDSYAVHDGNMVKIEGKWFKIEQAEPESGYINKFGAVLNTHDPARRAKLNFFNAEEEQELEEALESTLITAHDVMLVLGNSWISSVAIGDLLQRMNPEFDKKYLFVVLFELWRSGKVARTKLPVPGYRRKIYHYKVKIT